MLDPRRPRCVISITTKSTRKMKNRTFAIPAAATATPPNPRTAAMIATMRNSNAQYNIHASLLNHVLEEDLLPSIASSPRQHRRGAGAGSFTGSCLRERNSEEENFIVCENTDATRRPPSQQLCTSQEISL